MEDIEKQKKIMEDIEKQKKIMEDIEKQKAKALENVKKTAEAAAKMTVEEAMKAVSEKMEEIAGRVGKSVTEDDFKKEIAELQARVKQIKQTTSEEKTAKSIKDAIADALVEGAEKLKNFRGEEKLVMKAVTDASWEAGALDHATSEVRPTLYNSPYSPLYLRNIFPNVATDMGTVIIPQIGAITGAAAEWERGTGELGADVAKPEVSPAYKDVTVPMKWIAGITTVNRELLLNVKYLQSSITNTLLYSSKGLFAAENKMITDYLAANAVAYAGSKTIALEKIIDAAFNQLLGNYMAPTHVLMNQADYLTYIKLNKASGSGEYDVPNDTLMGFFGTGLETAVQIVPVPSIVAGTAYVVSAPEFEFINRLAPEIQIAEQHDVNFAFNKVTFRVEEMAAFVAKNLNAMVKITF